MMGIVRNSVVWPFAGGFVLGAAGLMLGHAAQSGQIVHQPVAQVHAAR